MMKEILYLISGESCQGTGGDLVRLLQTQRLNGFVAQHQFVVCRDKDDLPNDNVEVREKDCLELLKMKR